jgi:hypothetical protein
MTKWQEDRAIREHLCHGVGTTRVRICRDGQVLMYGSTDPYRPMDWWRYVAERDELLRQIVQEAS